MTEATMIILNLIAIKTASAFKPPNPPEITNEKKNSTKP